MKITRAAEYGVRCVYYLALQGKDIVANKKEIAKRMKIPAQFLTKVAQQLALADIIVIVQGAKGGFKLNSDPENITLLEVIEAIMGTLVLNDCLPHPDSCRRSPECSIHLVWQKAQQRLRETLKEANYKILINNESCINQILEP